MPRIVAGRFRGRRLYTARGSWLRPTADRVKETIYDILQNEIRGTRVLDLFAGSGNLGLEALSRGASCVVLVESAPGAIRVLRRNLELLGVREEVEVIRGDALVYLEVEQQQAFDIILADPPYDAGVEDALLEALPGAALHAGGWFILQHARHWRLQAPPQHFRHQRSKRFGTTVVDFLLRDEEEQA